MLGVKIVSASHVDEAEDASVVVETSVKEGTFRDAHKSACTPLPEEESTYDSLLHFAASTVEERAVRGGTGEYSVCVS